MPTSSEIQTLIASFASQLEAAARKAALEEVVANLGGTVARRAPVKRGPSRPAATAGAPGHSAIKPVTAGKRRSATDVEQMGSALYDFVKANPGARGEQIAAAMRSNVGTIRLPMRALIKAKRMKTQGQKRGMMYFVAGAMSTAPTAKKKSRRGNKKR